MEDSEGAGQTHAGVSPSILFVVLERTKNIMRPAALTERNVYIRGLKQFFSRFNARLFLFSQQSVAAKCRSNSTTTKIHGAISVDSDSDSKKIRFFARKISVKRIDTHLMIQFHRKWINLPCLRNSESRYSYSSLEPEPDLQVYRITSTSTSNRSGMYTVYNIYIYIHGEFFETQRKIIRLLRLNRVISM